MTNNKIENFENQIEDNLILIQSIYNESNILKVRINILQRKITYLDLDYEYNKIDSIKEIIKDYQNDININKIKIDKLLDYNSKLDSKSKNLYFEKREERRKWLRD